MSFNDLFRLVPIDYSIQAVKRPPAHQIANALLLNPEALDLIVYVEKEGVVSRRIVTWAHQKTARSSCTENINNRTVPQQVHDWHDGIKAHL